MVNHMYDLTPPARRSKAPLFLIGGAVLLVFVGLCAIVTVAFMAMTPLSLIHI